MNCPNCGTQLRDGAVFCGMCGTKIEQKQVCKSCGAELTPGFRFCELCGTPVETAGSASVKIPAPAPTPASAPASAMLPMAIPEPCGEPFFKKWIAEHKDYAELKKITWISEFKADFAVARINGRFCLVKGSERPEVYVRDGDTGFKECAENYLCSKKSGYNDKVSFSDDGGEKSLDYWCCSFCFEERREERDEQAENNAYIAFAGKTPAQTIELPKLNVLISYDGSIIRAEIFDGFNIWIYPLGKHYYAELIAEDINKYVEKLNGVKLVSDPYLFRLVHTRSGKLVLDKLSADTPERAGIIWGGYPPIEYERAKSLFRDSQEGYASIADNSHYFNVDTGRLYKPDKNTKYRYSLGEAHEEYIIRFNNCVGNSGEPEIIDKNDNVIAQYNTQYLVSADGRFSDYIRCVGNYFIVSFTKRETLDEVNSQTVLDIYVYHNSYGSLSAISSKRFIVDEYINKDYKDSCGLPEDLVYFDDKAKESYGLFSYKNKLFCWFNIYEYIGKDDKGYAQYKRYAVLCDEKLNEIKRLDCELYSNNPELHNINDTLYLKVVQKDMIGTENDVLFNLNTDEQIVCVPKGQLVNQHRFIYHGDGFEQLEYSYKLGRLRAFGNPYFLIKLIEEYDNGWGLVDMKGNYLIPKSKTVKSIIGEAKWLPENLFGVEYADKNFRVFDTNGRMVFEGKRPWDDETLQALCDKATI